MPHRDRRSGHGRTLAEDVSRRLTAFGRYPESRPPGLHVDPHRGLSLNSLVEVWGIPNDLSKEDILEAVRQHMLPPDGREGNFRLRFQLHTSKDGRIWIKVGPKRGEAPLAAGLPRLSRRRAQEPRRQRAGRPASYVPADVYGAPDSEDQAMDVAPTEAARAFASRQRGASPSLSVSSVDSEPELQDLGKKASRREISAQGSGLPLRGTRAPNGQLWQQGPKRRGAAAGGSRAPVHTSPFAQVAAPAATTAQKLEMSLDEIVRLG